jgi:hypothetical protein
VHLLGVKLEIRLIFGVIIQFFVCGSEFRARWHVWMKDSCGAWEFLSNYDKKSSLPKKAKIAFAKIASYNTQEATWLQS